MKENITTTIIVIGGAVLSIFLDLLGGWDPWLQCLVGFMSVDFVLGLYCGYLGKSTKSETGAITSGALTGGIFKKSAVLAVVLLCFLLENASGIGYIRNGIITAFILGEGTSIIEKWGLLGYAMPDKFKEVLEALKSKQN